MHSTELANSHVDAIISSVYKVCFERRADFVVYAVFLFDRPVLRAHSLHIVKNGVLLTIIHENLVLFSSYLCFYEFIAATHSVKE